MTPVACYLDIEGIVGLAKAQGVDAIHPGQPLTGSRAASM